jgi:hypothetical protein
MRNFPGSVRRPAADSSKFARSARLEIARLDSFDLIVTDAAPHRAGHAPKGNDLTFRCRPQSFRHPAKGRMDRRNHPCFTKDAFGASRQREVKRERRKGCRTLNRRLPPQL